MLERGVPEHIRSHNASEIVAKSLRGRIAAVGAKTAYIGSGSRWENGHVESVNFRLRDELLSGEIFCSSRKSQVLIQGWRQH